jgi:hypothetical protein
MNRALRHPLVALTTALLLVPLVALHADSFQALETSGAMASNDWN